MKTEYPIDEIMPSLLQAFRDHPALVLHAPPGAGKTTRVPLALLDVLPRDGSRIVMLEPRRIAAVSAARWMARTLGEQPGETVGYTIRFEKKASAGTRIEVVTEGVLTRRIQSDPALERTAVVIFDEFHERSIHADLALALCLDIRAALRPDLRIVVMSATLDCGPVAALLGNAPVVSSLGKSFPVEDRYLGESPATGPPPPRIVAAVRTALRETNGDMLVFFPGAGEIRAAAKGLQEALDLTEERLSLHPLYGDLPFEEQERAILPSLEKRKIVLATNIAETSLTIQGVHVVIDSGLTRMLRYDPATGMNRLVTGAVSRASAEQRRGRAGRLGPGVCFRLYSRHDFNSFLPFTQPEILLSDLSQLALELAVWGVRDPAGLAWLDAPPAAAWESGLRLLVDLGAVDTEGAATEIGKAMVRLPLHPRLGRLMIKAEELGCLRLGADLAAILTERDLLRRRAGERVIDEPDISERLDALRSGRAGREVPAGVDPSALRAVERTANQLLGLMRRSSAEAVDAGDHETIARLLLSAYPDRVCKQREEAGQGFVHAQGRGVRISRDSHLLSSPYLIAVHVDAGEKAEGFIHLAAPVTEELIRAECSHRITIARRVEWDWAANRIVAAREERFGTLVLSSHPVTPGDEETAPIMCDAIRSSPGMVSFSRETRQFLGRVALLARVFPEEHWPDLSGAKLLEGPREWLLPWLKNIRTGEQLAGLNLLPALRATLTWEQARLLEERTPAAITVPSGSRVQLDYASGDLPVLAVKLQELFGLADTPRLAEGRVTVLLHLLSPARRPVQITRDLKGFWNTGYPQVKKDLKGRYPKHPWPDDPWNAAPTKRTKPRGQ